jgi:hypothetical protein
MPWLMLVDHCKYLLFLSLIADLLLDFMVDAFMISEARALAHLVVAKLLF